MHFTTLLPLLTLLTPLLAAPTPSSTSLTKRHSADDATNVGLVKEWMTANLDPADPYVFYSDSSVGQGMARAFSEANEEEGYKWFYSIFSDDFKEEFGGADPSADTDIARACSQAMGEFATGEVRVFNHAGGKSIPSPGKHTRRCESMSSRTPIPRLDSGTCMDNHIHSTLLDPIPMS